MEVHQDPRRGAALVPDIMDAPDPRVPGLRRPVRGIDADQVHPGVQQGDNPFFGVPGGAQSGNDLGAADRI